MPLGMKPSVVPCQQIQNLIEEALLGIKTCFFRPQRFFIMAQNIRPVMSVVEVFLSLDGFKFALEKTVSQSIP